jgi:N-hydroxyarylamine O-acetyltransferase
MVLRVDLPEGAYLCDVGFGGLTLTAPLRLAADAEQDTPHGVHRLLAVPHGFRLQVRLAGGWESIYRFTLEEQAPLDWKVSNYFISTHVDSVFTQTLMAARPLPGLRYALRGPQLAVYGADGTVERQVLASGDEIAAALDQTFDLDVPDEAGPFLDRIAKAGA